MSMNLHLSAEIDAVSKIGNHRIVERFALYQTPTNVTRDILKSNNVKEAYLTWAKQLFNNSADYKNYKKTLNKWLEDHEGWEVEWYEM